MAPVALELHDIYVHNKNLSYLIMDFEFIFFLILIAAIFVLVSVAKISSERGRNPFFWVVSTLFFPLSLPVMLLALSSDYKAKPKAAKSKPKMKVEYI